MHGNASEWTQDIFVEAAQPSGLDDESDVAAEFDDQRTVRGGNSQELVPYLRAANRSGNASYWGVSPRVGFRIARTLAVRAAKD
jgi:formylglycine-generating enzyme required for sulfatase activity